MSCTLKQICQFGTVYYVTPGYGPKSTFTDCELWQMQQFIQSSCQGPRDRPQTVCTYLALSLHLVTFETNTCNFCIVLFATNKSLGLPIGNPHSSAAQDGADVHYFPDKLGHPVTICYKLCKIGLYGCVCHMVPLRTQKTMKRRWQWVKKVREHDCRSRTTPL